MTDTLTSEHIAAAATPEAPGASKFMESMKANIASVGQPPAQIAPVTTPPATPATPAAPPTTPPNPPATANGAAAKPGDDEGELPKNISGAKAEDWDRLKSYLDKHKTRASTLAEQLKAKDEEITKLKLKPALDPEIQSRIEKTEKERDDLSTRLERSNIEQHPKFQAHFNARFEQVIAAAKSAAGEKSDQVLAVLEAPPSKWRKSAIGEITEGMEEVDKLQLIVAINEYDKVRAEKSQLLANSKTEMEKLRQVEAQERAEQQKQSTTLREARYAEVLKAAREVDAFKTIEGNAEHNAVVAANEAALRKFITQDGLTFEEYANAPIQAAEAKRLKVIVDSLTKERDELKKAVAEYQGTNPAARGAQPASNGGANVVSTPYGDSLFMGKFREGIREAGF